MRLSWNVIKDQVFGLLGTAAQALLDARATFPNSTLANLYGRCR